MKSKHEIEKIADAYIDNMESRSFWDSFISGYETCQKEYEEKLRWIPVHEKMPEQLTYIELKDSCDRIFSGSLNMQNEFRDRLHNDKLHFIVSWRSFL